MVLVKDYIKDLSGQGIKRVDIAERMDITVAMISAYTLHGYFPSITVAKRVFATDGITLHPYNSESLLYEIKKIMGRNNGTAT